MFAMSTAALTQGWLLSPIYALPTKCLPPAAETADFERSLHSSLTVSRPVVSGPCCMWLA